MWQYFTDTMYIFTDTMLGSTPGLWPTMLQSTKSGVSSLPLSPLLTTTDKLYFHSLPSLASTLSR